MVYAAFSLIASIRMMRYKADILYSRPPHPFSDVACLLYRLFHPDVKIISDTTDLWPDALEYTHMNRFMKTFMMGLGSAVNYIVYDRVDTIVTHNSELKKILLSRFSKPTFTLPGAIDLEEFKAMGKDEAMGLIQPDLKSRLAGKFVIVYAGMLGSFQQPGLMIDLANQLDDSYRLLIVGTGPLESELRRRANASHLTNVVFLGIQPHEMMPALYGVADVFLLTYAPTRFLKIGLPKKFIEYSASGRPIICVCLPCAASDLCVSAKAGFVIDPDDLGGIANKVSLLKANREVRESMGKNARHLAENTFSIGAAAKTLAEVVDSWAKI